MANKDTIKREKMKQEDDTREFYGINLGQAFEVIHNISEDIDNDEYHEIIYNGLNIIKLAILSKDINNCSKVFKMKLPQYFNKESMEEIDTNTLTGLMMSMHFAIGFIVGRVMDFDKIVIMDLPFSSLADDEFKKEVEGLPCPFTYLVTAIMHEFSGVIKEEMNNRGRPYKFENTKYGRA